MRATRTVQLAYISSDKMDYAIRFEDTRYGNERLTVQGVYRFSYGLVTRWTADCMHGPKVDIMICIYTMLSEKKSAVSARICDLIRLLSGRGAHSLCA